MSRSPRHHLLQRQLRRAGLAASETEDSPLARLLDMVNESYLSWREDRLLLEHSMDLMNDELDERRQRLEEQLDRALEMKRTLEDRERRLDFQRARMPLGLIEWDADWRVVDWNPAAEALFGWTREEMLGQTSTQHIVPEGQRDHTRSVVEALLHADPVGEHSVNDNVHKDGSAMTCEWFNTPLLDDHGEVVGALSLVQDISRRVRWERQLVETARIDALTGLVNRRTFLATLDRSLRDHREGLIPPFAVLFIDLDRFKQVNDSLGHAAGDEVLRRIAKRLDNLLRPGDTIARLGGDEFAACLENIDNPETALVLTRRLQDKLAQPMEVDGRELFVTASIGVALISPRFETAEDLLRDADVAMYRAKSSPSEKVTLFDLGMLEEAQQRIHRGQALQTAVLREEFELDYQPIIDLRTGHVTGIEALVRWTCPDGSVLSGSELLQLAEETGVILALGEWVFAEATRQRAQWSEWLEPDAWLSVNLTARQLMSDGLMGLVEASLEQTGLRPGQIAVEITETALLREDVARETVLKLKKLGLVVLLDGFGSGDASLVNLVSLPVDMAKIDQTFVRRSTYLGRDFIQALLSVASSLGIQTVAEGIERIEELNILEELGADMGQGALLGQPMTPSALRAWVTRWSKPTRVLSRSQNQAMSDMV